MSTRFVANQGNNTDALDVIADELHVVSGVGSGAVGTSAAQAAAPTAAEVLGGVITETGTAGATTFTLPTAELILAAYKNAQIGSKIDLTVINASNNTLTFTTSTGNTVGAGQGTVTQATNTSNRYIGVFTNVTTGAAAITWYTVLKTAS